MGNVSPLQLAAQAETAFSYLEPSYRLQSARFLDPIWSARSGFELEFSGAGSILIRYSDLLEFEVYLDGEVIFGASRHPRFSGNQFSPVHLSEQLGEIAQAIVTDLVGGARHAV